ncbi:tRNA dihydrouridine synthase [Aureimonas jatrophae]|nr:tRNA-dihydrouridine synthase [Aureimonas jatrophae]MBB3949870.1 nifR3 family TIM-barrel protein [Aureimonas jatrophae]
MLTNTAPSTPSTPSQTISSLPIIPEAFDVVLAPLSGITDVPFRRLVRSFGCPIVYSEMVASGELLRGVTESFLRAQHAGDGLHAVQLAGRDPSIMQSAAHRLADEGADLIDVNMGCPAKKVVGGASGAALMRDLDLAKRLIAATLEGAKNVPVSVKMRLGWDRLHLNASELAEVAYQEGAARLTIHGRTRDQFYDGTADWSAIFAVNESTPLPVTANGDLTDATQVSLMRERSGCKSLMMGRGACGRPWAPALLAGRIRRSTLAGYDMGTVVIEHYEAMLAHYGQTIGLRHARKHLGWYLDGLSHVIGVLPIDSSKVMLEPQPTAVIKLLRQLFSGISVLDIENAQAQLKAA